MRLIGLLQNQLRVVVVAGAMVSAACATKPATAPGPVTRTPQLVPAPVSMAYTPGASFTLQRTSNIVVDAGSAEVTAIGEQLAALIRPPTGYPVTVVSGPATPGAIVLRLNSGNATLGNEGYQLTVTPDSVRVAANSPAGLFYATQTIRQLLPVEIESEMGVDRNEWSIPALTITDYPRFGWRGAMLDVARHFFTPREVEQYIDLLAMYKMNVLHLHLADDQGWRIQLNSRPKLTEVGSLTQVGGGPGGFFTQQDYQNIIRYAAARYITIVPEIDMPAHSNAGLTGYPEYGCSARQTGLYTGTDVGWSSLCVDKEETYAYVDDIVREISAMTPGPYFHIGGDEVQTLTNQQYVKFVERAQAIVNKYGKKMIGWEEITKAHLLPTTIAQQWKSDSATAAVAQGAKLIMSPSNKIYLDMKYTPATELGLNWAAFIEERDAYDWDPAMYLKGVGEQNILGVEAPIWSETLRNIGAVFYLALPRMPAVAEIGWSPQAGRSWESFRSRIVTHEPRWHYLGWNYFRSPQLPW
ncbi:MAG: beta-N-acetylhexosaminidase [Gemmatimonadaceae bacterium]